MPFLPTSKADMQSRNWDYLDIIIVSGDAYVDHPSFGAAIIARSLEAEGFRVGIIAQPRWDTAEDFTALGTPRLFFGVTAGNMDSMVNHYTAQKKLRSDDAYSPGGLAGFRPDRATMIYTNMLKHAFKGVPVIIGGIEASLRRISHYDYWQDKVRNSILADSKADMLIYGMAEKPICELAGLLANGMAISEIQNLPSSVVFSSSIPDSVEIILPDAETCKDKTVFYNLTKQFVQNSNAKVLYQKTSGRWLRHNPPAKELSQQEIDAVYNLPYMNAPHPMYKGNTIPAFEQIKDSITSHRGCYGGCNFCAIACHQGRKIQSRSEASLLKEAALHKGTISDVGGPTANMYASRCKLNFPDSCKRGSCLYPAICPNLIMNHDAQLNLLEKINALPQIKHVFIASGIRHDMAITNSRYIKAIATKYTGGRLKLAPEHSVPKILRLMGKPDISSYMEFSKQFFAQTKAAGIKRQIIPYLIIGHPGTTKTDALALRDWLHANKIIVEQVQEFTPTPMSISTCMYYTGLDFETGEAIEIPRPGQVREQKKMILG
jgi:uncharacterized radical SAM protein YgiQ